MAFGTKFSLRATCVAVLAGVIGITAAVLGFIAERKRITVNEMVWDDGANQCIMPRNESFSLSISAAFLVLLMQVLLTAAGGCTCCNYRIDKLASPAKLAIKSLVVSWTLCVVAMIFYFYGAGVSSNHHAQSNPRPVLPASTSASCGYAVDSGVFAGAAFLTILATASGITYYLAASRVYIHSWLCQPTYCIEVAQLPPPKPIPLAIITTT
ncbi:protein VASCULATURE COMPLEXITY AND CONNECTIVITY [Physcomitrium patens]|uniref:Uncharacterized protein n=1 Tax=Physcomitrium patens TaxID=3218 RepID=A0A2K1KT28_PHYPA|nr:uncharacterized protein LOC112279773 [Physcomitrium patens]PNR56906.1 hypothetical protein PHYPA_003898 [Physcomitrium patens]|eukprot:XP_024370209.1 uncharacterized protein LOC112279773 [Physcomitrella patens]